MTKLKSAEYWESKYSLINKDFRKFIRSIQQNAIEAALELASNEAKTMSDISYNEDGGFEYQTIDKQSITSLINHKDLKV